MGIFRKQPDLDPHQRLARAEAAITRAEATMDSAEFDSRSHKAAARDHTAAIIEHDVAQVALGNPGGCLTPKVVADVARGTALARAAHGCGGLANVPEDVLFEIERAAAEIEAALSLSIDLEPVTDAAGFRRLLKENGAA